MRHFYFRPLPSLMGAGNEWHYDEELHDAVLDKMWINLVAFELCEEQTIFVVHRFLYELPTDKVRVSAEVDSHTLTYVMAADEELCASMIPIQEEFVTLMNSGDM